MSEKIKNQQTLFQFVSLRAPEKSKKEHQEKRFVFHTDNESGVFFTAMQNKTTTQTKWEVLNITANSFTAITSEENVRKINDVFFETSEWITLYKSSLKIETIHEKIKDLPLLDANTELNLWDNLFYQVVTQEDFYVKEALIQMLVLQNMLKYKKQAGTIEIFQSHVKQLINARVVLPLVLFDNTNLETTNASEASKKDEELVLHTELIDAKEIEHAKIHVENIHAILEELDSLDKEHKDTYQSNYDTEITAYNERIKPQIEEYQKQYTTEYRRLYKETKDTEEVRNLIDVATPQIEEFNFNFPKVPEVSSLVKTIDKDTYSVLIELIDIAKIRSFTDLKSSLEKKLEETNKVIISKSKLSETITTFGDVALNLKSGYTGNNTSFTFNICSVRSVKNTGKVAISMNIQLPHSNFEVASMLYHLHTSSGSNTNGYFQAVKNGNTLTLRNLFNNSISFSSNSSIQSLSGEITFTNGQKYSFDVNPFSLVKCYIGKLKLVTSGGTNGNPPTDDTSFRPNSFGYRQLGIADYKKVVSEVCCYEVGEVAHIENVMAREMREKVTTKFHQKQVVETESNEIETENISDTTTTERFEMQTEVSKLLQEQKQFQAGVNVHTSWGNTTLDANAGYASNVSKEQSNLQAVQEAKEITQRAMERIVSRVKNERVTSVTDEFTEENKHRFDNTAGDSHVSGVFRFVNAIYKNQIYNYGKRLMYEFTVPQPSKLHKIAMSVSSSNLNTNNIEKPVDPRTLGYTDFTTIDKNNYQSLASQYNAEVDVYKEDEINVSQHFLKEDWTNDGRWHKSGEFAIKIPENYFVDTVKGYFDPMNGSHNATWNNMWGTIYIGTKRITIPGRTNDMYFQVSNFDINIEEELSLTLTTWDIATYNFNLIVHCKLSDSTKQQWKKNTFDAIIGGYEEQLRAYNEKLTENQDLGIQILDSNPLFYRQIEQNVLRANCISYLLDQTNPTSVKQFGLKMYNDNPSFTDYKVTQDKRMDDYGSFVKFMEQAFEWNVMSYHFYPYYWGNKSDWSELYQFESNDAIFRSFMQSGMARVIVTVKPGFENAVMHYMATGQIWNGGQMPILGDPLYLSIVDELEEQEYTVEKTWNTTLPTHLIALQKSGVAVDASGLPCGDDCADFAGKKFKTNTASLGNEVDQELEEKVEKMESRMIENVDIENGYLKLTTDEDPRQVVAQISVEAIKRAMEA